MPVRVADPASEAASNVSMPVGFDGLCFRCGETKQQIHRLHADSACSRFLGRLGSGCRFFMRFEQPLRRRHRIEIQYIAEATADRRVRVIGVG